MNFIYIGHVDSPVKEPVDMDWGEVESNIVLNNEYAPGLLGLDQFSHAIIVTHLHQANWDAETHLRRHPQEREDMPLLGIFAQRAKHRPNSIGVTAVQILKVLEDSLKVRGLDVIDGTPVLDIKPYVPQYDKRNATIPDWMKKLMENYF
jgi:tRNA-Thr(GGU) m(6)t(6)A37 methyltransferase TsaA